MSTLLVTGGAGFIGSNFVQFWHERHPMDRIVVLDALTYAGNRANLAALDNEAMLHFVHGDICDAALVSRLFSKYDFQSVVHFAAESHVDRSIVAPDAFIRTNVQGTLVLLQAAVAAWKGKFQDHRFHHISTDEVYGSLEPNAEPFTETTPYDPRSPYAASKAGSDLLVRAYGHTYGLPVTISNSSNNYGRFQFPEKLIPLMVLNALQGRQLPVYGDGMNVRDWLYVDDHCAAIEIILEKGNSGETYNVGGGNELNNLELISIICRLIDERIKSTPAIAARFPNCPASVGGNCQDLLTFVQDRPGHDRRYAICGDKISRELGFSAQVMPSEGFARTVEWYMSNEEWWQPIQSGEYRDWVSKHYGLGI